jgi:methyltransferase (TIGR00027 family)
MQTNRQSQTAEFMAIFRVSGRAQAKGQRAINDPLAAAMLPPKLRLLARLFRWRALATLLNAYIDFRWPGARTSAIARTHLIDDWITEALPGIDQVVFLGAGFDTRAWRLSALASVQVFEVDHPDTATGKQARLRAAAADLSRVRFVAVDFEKDDFSGALCRAGFEPTRSAIVVWEGVSQYLNDRAVSDVVHWAGGLAGGSRFIFTYIHAGVLDGSVAFAGAQAAMRAVVASGEPWQFGLKPRDLPAFLSDRGLALVKDLGADDYRAEVMGAAALKMEGYGFYHTVLARVAHA